MSYFSLTFLLLFLPCSLLVYYLAPCRVKNTALLVLSLVFYTMLEQAGVLLLILSILFDYCMMCVIRFKRPGGFYSGIALTCSVTKTICLILYAMTRFQMNSVTMPIGLLIYTLSATSCVVDFWRGEIAYERNLIDFALYNCFFGRIFMGPYVKYSIIRGQLKQRNVELGAISTGMILLIRGIAKKVILADNLLVAFRSIGSLERGEVTILSAWMLVISLSLGLFYTLSAYSDVARGLGYMFCFKMPRNMNYPLHERSIREFVYGFNSTFFAYLRQYVYRPLGGKRYGRLSDICNTLLVMLLYSCWFRLGPNTVLLGVVFTFFMLGEKYIYGKLLQRLPSILARIYTDVMVLCSLCLLAVNTPQEATHLLRTMFSFDAGLLYSDKILYLLSQNYWVLLIGCLFSFALVPRLSHFLHKRIPETANILSVGLNVGLLLVSVMFLL